MNPLYPTTLLAGLVLSAYAFATQPANYDTRFLLSAHVPESATITDAQGVPVTEIALSLTPSGSQHAAPATLSADTLTVKPLRIWSNSTEAERVRITIDDGQSATGQRFSLNGYGRNGPEKMEYTVSTVDDSGKKTFLYSGAQHDYTLTPMSTHAEKSIAFVFESSRAYGGYTPGNYSGIAYASVAVLP